MQYHHNELNFKRGIIEDDWSLEEIHDFEEVTRIEDLEHQEIDIRNQMYRTRVRDRIDNYLDKKRTEREQMDTFDEDYYYDDDE